MGSRSPLKLRPFDASRSVFGGEMRVGAVDGAARLDLPIRLTEGRQGFGPSLGLGYGGSLVNSEFGLGWSLAGTEAVGRDLNWRLPTYREGEDRLHLGGLEIVPVLDAGGAPVSVVRDGYLVERFRYRVERTFERIERWTERATDRAHWRHHARDGSVSIYGRRADDSSRLADPGDASRVYQWLVESRHHPRGDAIAFEYKPEDLSGVDGAAPAEQSRLNPAAQAMRYPKKIRYGVTRPWGVDDPMPVATDWRFEVVFDYGEHQDVAELPQYDEGATWPARADTFSSYRPGFELRTRRLCKRILMFHRFDELGAPPVAVGATEFSHEARDGGAVLVSARYRGYRVDTTAGGAPAASRATPPVSMTYARAQTGDGFVCGPAVEEGGLTAAIERKTHLFVDLLGEGVPGLLTQNGNAWLWRENLGEGRFAPARTLDGAPQAAELIFAVRDTDGDGRTEVSSLIGREAGGWNYDTDTQRWGGHVALARQPRVDFGNSAAQLTDLNGDGYSDILIDRHDHFLWYEAERDSGFKPAKKLPKPQLGSAGNVALDGDSLSGFRFADMSGDGLADLVRIGEGRVEYWPHLGHGRFGQPVLMDAPPSLPRAGDVVGARIRLVDITGNGHADLLHIGDGEIQIWRNLSGNRFGPEIRLTGLPHFDTLSEIQVFDLLGRGRPCLVWANQSLVSGEAPIQYLPLFGDVGPGLLTAFDNGVGLRHELQWTWSGTEYLAAKTSARPWASRTPRHQPVVREFSGVDQVTGQRRTTLYRYRDGAFDSVERSFVGFGLVETLDREVGVAAPEEPPPVLSRVWNHMGGAQPATLADAWDGDPQPQSPPLITIADEATLSTREYDDAQRVISGLVLRREVYACDQDGVPDAAPLLVAANAYRVSRLQAARDAVTRAVFAPLDTEKISWTYEDTPTDPRISHRFKFSVSPYGATTLSATFAYARRAGATRDPAQLRVYSAAERSTYHQVDDDDSFAPDVRQSVESFEITGLGSRTDPFSYAQAEQRVSDALANVQDFGAAAPVGIGARRLEWKRFYYWHPDASSIADASELGYPLLLHHIEWASMPRTLFDQFYGSLGTSADLIAESDLTEADGYLWVRGATSIFEGRSAFHRVREGHEGGGGIVRYTYDPDHLAALTVRTPTGNTLRGEMDPVTCAYWRVTDHNDAVTEVLYDALGQPVAGAAYGDQRGADGAVHRFGAASLTPSPNPHGTLDVDAALLDLNGAVGTASSAVFYDFDAFATSGLPGHVLRVSREDCFHDGEGGTVADGEVRVDIEYHDGDSRILQNKLRAGPGPAISRGADGSVLAAADGRPLETDVAERWLTSGFELYSLKGQVVARFEPFFSPAAQYEEDDILRFHGAARRMHHDALGRTVRIDYPDDTVSRMAFEAWRVISHDRNDAVVGTGYEAARAGLPASDPQRMALDQARAHADTPQELVLDALGNTALAIEHGELGTRLETRHESDPGAGHEQLTDPRGLVSNRTRRDMLGRAIQSVSVDAGETLVLLGWNSKPRRAHYASGTELRYSYDSAGRLTEIGALDQSGLDSIVERRVYGEDPAVTDALQRNLNGAVARIFDDAGVEEIVRRSPFGTRLEQTRQFCTDYRDAVDWSNPASVSLEADVFRSERRLDALGRPRRFTLADGTRVAQEFGQLGEANDIRVTTPDGVLSDSAVLLGADYNALGRRRRLELGNGVVIGSTFEPDTMRLERLTATHADGRVLQDLSYAYDPVGNAVFLDDASQAPGAAGAALANLSVTAEKIFSFDAHYRLIEARGRTHRALQLNHYRNGLGPGQEFKSTQHISLDNGMEVERYRRTYSYDAGGNLLQIRHIAATLNWTRDIWVSPTSNRSLVALDLNGLPVSDPEGAFDASGNVIRMPHLREMRWNWRGRLARSVVIDRGGPGLDDAEYNVYDVNAGRVRRVVERIVGGEMEIADTRFLPDCEIRTVRRASDTSDSLARSTVQIIAAGEPVARLHQWTLDTGALEVDDVATKKLRYQLGDHLGSVTLELDDTGDVVTAEEYFPFGGTSFIAGRDRRDVAIKENRFSGALRDDATGFYCHDYRHYAPWIGNWISPDPAGTIDGLNLYRYAHNNPVRFVDKTGLDTEVARLYGLDQASQEVRDASRTNTPEARGIFEAYARRVTFEHDGVVYGFRPEDVTVRAITNQGGEFVRWWAEFRSPVPLQAEIVNFEEGEPIVGGGEGDAEPATEEGGGGGAGDRGTGPGVGDEGEGTGGGGEDEITIGPGDGDGTGEGTGDGDADEAPVNPGDGEGGDGDNPRGARDGSERGTEAGADEGTGGAPGGGATGEPGGRRERGGRGCPDDQPSPDERQRAPGGGEPPPPGLPTGDVGIPWSPDLEVTPLDQIPPGARLTTDPSEVRRHGRGGDPRGTPGGGESPSASPSGTAGNAGSGREEGQGSGQGAGGSGPGNGNGAPDGGSTEGRRGLKGGMGSHELPWWLGWVDSALDGLQVCLDIIGLIPGFGEIADGINGLISLLRGDYLGASLSFAAMIPFAGWAATAGKFGRRAVNVADATSDVGGAILRHGDEAADAATTALRNADESVAAAADSIPINARNNAGAVAFRMADLAADQARLLDDLPGALAETVVHRRAVSVNDLAALTAATGDEFAMFTLGSRRLIVRGTTGGVPMARSRARELAEQGWRWSTHTHPGMGSRSLARSGGDIDVLEEFFPGQGQSLILNSVGSRNVWSAAGDNIIP